jgi:hypothetical protein
MCCKRNETRLRGGGPHAYKKGYSLWLEQREHRALQSQEQVNTRPTAARDCTLPVIVLVTITFHLCQMIPGVTQSNMHVDTTAAMWQCGSVANRTVRCCTERILIGTAAFLPSVPFFIHSFFFFSILHSRMHSLFPSKPHSFVHFLLPTLHSFILPFLPYVTPSFLNLFIHSFPPSLPSLIHSFFPSILQSIHFPLPPSIHSFISSFLPNLTPSFISSFLPSIHSFFPSMHHSIHSFIPYFTPLIHSFHTSPHSFINSSHTSLHSFIPHFTVHC